MSVVHHILCPVYWLKRLFVRFPMNSKAYLFSSSKMKGLSYALFHKRFRSLCKAAGLSGRFASHSLRRGGATCMANLGISVSDIKDCGIWSSDCVFDYIFPSDEHRRSVDSKVASVF